MPTSHRPCIDHEKLLGNREALPEEPLRNRVLRILGLDNPATSVGTDAPQKFILNNLTCNDLHGDELIRNVIDSQPGMLPFFESLMDPLLELDEIVGLLDELNKKYGPHDPGSGSYYLACCPLPCGMNFRVKLFTNMRNGLIFGVNRL